MTTRAEPLPTPPRGELRDAVAGARSVECALGDFGSVARGKRVLAADFVAAAGCRLPSVLFGLTTTGGSPPEVFGPLLPADYRDIDLVPDLATLGPRPGRDGEVGVVCEPTGRWHAAAYGRDIDAAELSPRAVLRAVVAALAEAGLRATVAPELEMFLLQPEAGGLAAARPRPGSPVREVACEAYSLERLTQFEPYFDELHAAAAALRIPLTGHQHEAALAQYEVNFAPGDPLAQADAVWRFKRLAREIGQRHGLLASFAAKPFLDQPGAGMHWHVSLRRAADGAPLFAAADGSASDALMHFIAGVQAGAPAAMALFAPLGMSFDRITLSDASPTHADWGDDDRHAALRIPASSAAARRVENRLPGGDANPYLVLAATLALGLEGLRGGRQPRPGRDPADLLPRDLPAALGALGASAVLRRWLGDPLVDLYLALKRHEHAERSAAADPRAWDLRHLIELA